MNKLKSYEVIHKTEGAAIIAGNTKTAVKNNKMDF